MRRMHKLLGRMSAAPDSRLSLGPRRVSDYHGAFGSGNPNLIQTASSCSLESFTSQLLDVEGERLLAHLHPTPASSPRNEVEERYDNSVDKIFILSYMRRP
jgi:hypothetical protein